MKKILVLLIGGIAMTTLTVGCAMKENDPYLIPVQEYTGAEYPADESKERWEYIDEHREDIEKVAIDWVEETFGLEVEINHIYPRNGAAISTAQWVQDPDLKIKVVSGLDEKNERVLGVNPSMDAENNIMSYIVYKIYEEEFERLEKFIAEYCKQENLYGLTDEYIHNMGSFASNKHKFFYINASYLDYTNTYEAFLANPFINIDELQKIFEDEFILDKELAASKGIDYAVSCAVALYSYNEELNEEVLSKFAEYFVEQSYLPELNYLLLLKENTMDSRTNSAKKIYFPPIKGGLNYLKMNREEE